MNTYNLIVIGAGPGGYTAAAEAAKNGMSVALIEKENLGGTCLNKGCIPTKALLHAANIYRTATESENCGINCEGATFDIVKMYQNKDDIVAKLRNGIAAMMKAKKITVINANAYIRDAHTVIADEKELYADNILIATGSTPFVPEIEGLREYALTSDDLLTQAEFYDSMIIIGGGVIGMEFADMMTSLGCKVTVIEYMPRILSTLDREFSQNMTAILKKRGAEIICSAKVIRCEKTHDSIKCTYLIGENENSKEVTIEASSLLAAVGRKADTEKLFPENFIQTQKGKILTDKYFRTNVPGIYAIGDAAYGSVMLAHYASAQAINAVSAMLEKEALIDLSVVPSCIYVTPEIACVGICADEAKEKGIEVKTLKYPMSANGKMAIECGDRGFVKIVTEAESGIILGAQLMCPHASDMINEISTAITNKLTVSDIRKTIHPHPSFGEALAECASIF